jgi:Na+/proline symporter
MIYCSGANKTLGRFFPRRQTDHWWAAGLSIYGPQLSAITFMSTPAKTFATNWTYFVNSVGILLVCTGVVVIFLFAVIFAACRLLLPTNIGKRFSLPVRLCGSIFFILFQLGRMAIIIFLPAIALAAMTGIPIIGCILIMGIFCTIYTVLGGIEAVIWTDVLQVVVLTGGALSACCSSSSAFRAAGVNLSNRPPGSEIQLFRLELGIHVSSVWVVYLGGFSPILSYTSDQVGIQRYLRAGLQQAARSIGTMPGCNFPRLFWFSAWYRSYVFYKQNPASLNPTLHTDGIFPWFVTSEFRQELRPDCRRTVRRCDVSLDSGMNSVQRQS